MGAEAACKATFKGKVAAGKARLETDVLQFRGGELKLAIPFKEMTSVTARGSKLTVTFPDGKASFDLGRAAASWADKILHPPSRLAKLGAKPDWKTAAIGISDTAFLEELQRAVGSLIVDRVASGCDAIFFGANDERDLTRLAALKKKAEAPEATN